VDISKILKFTNLERELNSYVIRNESLNEAVMKLSDEGNRMKVEIMEQR
jgi:hypothetical protein